MEIRYPTHPAHPGGRSKRDDPLRRQPAVVNQSSYPKLPGSEDGLLELAAWDIAAGGELTCDYCRSDLAADEK
jgi:hypothetical protein